MAEFREQRHSDASFLSVIPARTASTALAPALVDGLRGSDAVRAEAAFPAPRIAALQAEAERAHAAGRFAAARVGHARHSDPQLRGDALCWLDGLADAPEAAALLAELDDLRIALDRALLLGLAEVEAHYARYPAGAHYARHLDRLADAQGASPATRGDRVLSLVLYLNAGWRDADGGALRLYDAAGRGHDLLPRGGDLVAFLSDRVAHEVLPAARTRWSVAAWLRRAA
jgi:SM-20-related protein